MPLKKLSKFLTRDASLIAIECWYNGHANYFNEYTAEKLPLGPFRYKNGAFEFFRDPLEFELKARALSKLFKKNPAKLLVIHPQLKFALLSFKTIKSSSFGTLKKLQNYLNKACELFTQGYMCILVTHHLPVYYEHFKKHGEILFEESIVKEVIKWREAEGNIFFNEGVETIYFLLGEIAKKMGWQPADLYHLTLMELRGSIENKKLPLKTIQKRKNSIYLYFNDRVVYENKIASELKKLGYKLDEEKPKENFKQIKGTIANKGKARGNVKIVFNRQQLIKVKEGDILVAPMTSAWHLPAMKKCAGIITDEGGITCHAAIIARELNKPCIIGTKISTQILRDDNFVELDADKGFVRKVNKKGM